MSDLSEAEKIEIAEVIRKELDELGCKCPGTRTMDVNGADERAFGITEHFDDCPAVAHFSRPENQPEGYDQRASEQASSEAKEPFTDEQADPGSVPSFEQDASEGVRSAAPAEQPEIKADGVTDDTAAIWAARRLDVRRADAYRQTVPGPNVEGVRSSSQAKRDVAPVPKRGEKK